MNGIGFLPRQECAGKDFEFFKIFAASLAAFDVFLKLLGVDAVSYTHLDVYKRQAMGREGAKEGTEGVARVFSWNLKPRGEVRKQRSEVRKKTGTAGGLRGEISFFFDGGDGWGYVGGMTCLLYTSRCV